MPSFDPNHGYNADQYFTPDPEMGWEDADELEILERATDLLCAWMDSGYDWALAPRIQEAINSVKWTSGIDLADLTAEELEGAYDVMVGEIDWIDDDLADDAVNTCWAKFTKSWLET